MLAVPAARRQFSRQVARDFHSKLPGVSQGPISLRSGHSVNDAVNGRNVRKM